MKKLMLLVITILISATVIYIGFGQELKLQDSRRTGYTAVLPAPSPQTPDHHGF